MSSPHYETCVGFFKNFILNFFSVYFQFSAVNQEPISYYIEDVEGIRYIKSAKDNEV